MAPPTPTEAQLLSIRNTISNYSIALDTKDFDLLHSVFTQDLVADYSAVSPKNPTINGLEDFMTRIKTILNGRRTQHALSTQRLTFEEDGGKVVCVALTYFTANTFVTGDDGVLDHVSFISRA
jgi:ketosteroid isomerase-like protein